MNGPERPDHPRRERELNDAGHVGPVGPSSWIERQIREATERGEFDNLPGAGKPSRLAEDTDPDWWVKAKMAREGLETADLVPPVIALRREAQGFPESLLEFSREDDVRELLRDYNLRVIDDIRSPKFGPTIPVVAPRIDVDAMVERWRALRAEAARDSARDTATDDAGEMVNRPQPNEPPPVGLLMLLALVLAGSAIAQVAVLVNAEPMLIPKPVAGIILTVAVLGIVSIVRILLKARRDG